MKSKFEIFLDTDILTQCLQIKRLKKDSVFQKATDTFDHCYTSVINAAELFSSCSGKKETDKLKRSLKDIGILGIPFRYSLSIAEMVREIENSKSNNSLRDAIVLSMCLETKLPILTSNENRYKDLAKKFKVKIICEDLLRNNTSPELILKKAKIL